jgi:hypothetical protein
MKIKVLDTVVLSRDLPEHRLKQGDVGAVVEIYPPDGFEIEFVTGSGRTQALVTLRETDIRPVGAADMLAVRKVDAA